LGTGTDCWPATPTSYVWTSACVAQDALNLWFQNPDNLNTFAHISHTFTHESLNNATYADVSKEISFNQAWLAQSGIASAKRFSASGLIPPAITGLHNGDALQAWADNGITVAVGDNTRPVLLNTENEYYTLSTTMENNGYDGFPIMPRWATNIYFNCDTSACTVAEYQSISGRSWTFDQIIANERDVNTRHLLALRHDPFMFHQANLRQSDVSVSVNGKTYNYSLLMTWVETVVAEFVRLYV
jgi:hypothetical protein